MKPAPVGTKIRVIANSNDHNYTIGKTYTVTFVDDDGTFRAKDSNGKEGNWLRWSDCEPAIAIGWKFIRRSLPKDARDFLSAFEGLEELKLKPEIGDRILLSLPDLHERILEVMQNADEAEDADEEEDEDDEDEDSDDDKKLLDNPFE